MNKQEKEALERESRIFCGCAKGKTATTKSGEAYTVKGSYLDANGCMKTYGKGYSESFIQDTKYE